MASHLLVPLDGSQHAETALPHAIALARATGSELLLLRVVVPPTPFGGAIWPAVPPTRERFDWRAEIEAGEEYLRRVAGALAEQDIVARTAVQTGDPATAILMRADTYPPARMIVMATHGRSGLGRMVFGSVAEKVLHAASVPILVVHPGEVTPGMNVMPAYKTILVPLDGSCFAEQALVEATALARATGAGLELVSIVSPLDERSLAEAGVVPAWPLREHQAQREQTVAALERTAQALEAQGLKVRARLGSGQPADEIVQIAREDQADLIVMATHGRGGWQRLFVGDVALRVVRESERPVLLLRVEEQREPQETRTSGLLAKVSISSQAHTN